MWRGPPLAEFAYEWLAQAEIARLDELRLGALEELVEAKLALGRHAEVVGELESLIAEHPYRERLRSQLMLALYRSDRQAEALQVYQDARRKLVEELGIEPGERLRELERAILAQDPALILTRVESAATQPPAQAPRIPFVGRERELSELSASLDDACAGHGRLVLLVGEPGIGKSRLAEELIAQAESRGVQGITWASRETGHHIGHQTSLRPSYFQAIHDLNPQHFPRFRYLSPALQAGGHWFEPSTAHSRKCC